MSDFFKDTVQSWRTSSQSVMQEEAPGRFAEHQGHRTQLIISTERGTSEDVWMHLPWDGSASGDYIDGATPQAAGEALREVVAQLMTGSAEAAQAAGDAARL